MITMMQSEASECGLACMAMILAHHGRHHDLATLRNQNSLSLKGATLQQLIEVAGRYGLVSRPLRLELDELGELKLPCILHWDLNHFVVLSKVGKKTITIQDPAVGTRKIQIKEASEHFTGIALELLPGLEFKEEKSKPSVSFRQLTGSIGGLKRSLLQILLLSMALQAFALVLRKRCQGSSVRLSNRASG